MKKMLYAGASVIAYAFPVLAFAQAEPSASYWMKAVSGVGNVINAIIPVMVALGVVYFLYGVFTYMTAGDDDKKTAAKSKILYGIIGIFVMVSIWGLVNLLTQTTGVQNNAINLEERLPDVTQRGQ